MPVAPAARRSWKDGLFGLRKSAAKAPRAAAADGADDFSPLGASLSYTHGTRRAVPLPFSLAAADKGSTERAIDAGDHR